MLNFESGFFGISVVRDMREILQLSGYKVEGFVGGEKASLEKRKLATLALKIFVYRAQKYISAYSGILGKVDAVVFTGGIGERSAIVRNLIMKGVKIGEKLKVLAIPTNEELTIAREVGKLL
jgi:acetate kinase